MVRRLPLVRIGITLVVGSVLASLIMFYVSMGASMADMRGETMSTEPRDLAEHFLRNFLFVGQIPGFIFYSGLGALVVGIIRNFTRQEPAPES